MTLQNKIGFSLTCAALILALIHFGIQEITTTPTLLKLEKSFAEKDMERCVEALNRQLQHIERFVENRASWNDTYDFIQDIDLDYVQSNLLKNIFMDRDINLIYFIDNEGWVVWGKIYSANFSEEISLVDFPERLPKFHPLLQHSVAKPSISGAFITEKGPMLIATRPIIPRGKRDNPIGTLVVGQFIGADLLDVLISQTRVILKISPFQTKTTELAPIIDLINKGTDYPIKIMDNDSLNAYATFLGINGQPVLLLQGEIQRELFKQSNKSQHNFMILMGFSCLLIFLFLMIFLHKTTFLPLQNLILHAGEIRKQKDILSRLPNSNRSDEIGSLAREMNHLLDFQYQANETLENRVVNRTLELSASNNLLQSEINEHQKTQREFIRLNEELEAIFTTSRVGIMVLRGGRRLNKCNQRLAEIYGYNSPEEMKEMSMEKLHISHDHFLEFGEKYYTTLQQEAQIQVEYEFLKKDGSQIWCLVSGMAMDTSNPPDLNKGVTWVVDDITKRRDETQKLSELSKMQGMFATIGGVCHELGQPVQIISAHTQILKKQVKPNPHQVMNRIRSIYEQTERMGDILKSLQSISRFETTDYVQGMQILDIIKSSEDNPEEPSSIEN